LKTPFHQQLLVSVWNGQISRGMHSLEVPVDPGHSRTFPF